MDRPFIWVPFYAGVVVGLIVAAAIVAYGFSRPGSWLRRIGYIVLAFGIWLILILAGIWFIFVTNTMV